MKRGREDVYEADEDDYEYDAYGRPVAVAAADHDVTLVDAVEYEQEREEREDLALVRCYEAALQDYKLAHPSSFEPMRERPRSKAEKAQFAPLSVSFSF